MVITGASHVPNRGSSPRGGITILEHIFALSQARLQCQFDTLAEGRGYGPVKRPRQCQGAAGVDGGFGPLF